MSTTELLSCPFCGGKAGHRRESDADWSGKGFAFIACGGCGARTRGVYGTYDPSEWADARADWNRRASQAQQPAPAEPTWRCFHCNEVFTSTVDAAFHFGYAQLEKPACLVDAVELRNLELQLSRYREEDTDLHRQIARMECEHGQALRSEEEKGYARGLKDAVADGLAAAAVQPPVVPLTEEE